MATLVDHVSAGRDESLNISRWVGWGSLWQLNHAMLAWSSSTPGNLTPQAIYKPLYPGTSLLQGWCNFLVTNVGKSKIMIRGHLPTSSHQKMPWKTEEPSPLDLMQAFPWSCYSPKEGNVGGRKWPEDNGVPQPFPSPVALDTEMGGCIVQRERFWYWSQAA